MTRRSLRIGPGYREQVTLRDGSEAVLRAVRPEDKKLLLAGFERMSPESRYRRFFSVKTKLSEAELRYLTEVDGIDHVALGVVREVPGAEQGLGIGRVIRVQGRDATAEAAIAVADDAQGKGVGGTLLRRLLEAATERGMSRVQCEVLADNVAMLDLLRWVAPDVELSTDGPVVTAVIDIGERERPPEVHRSPLYELLRMAAKGKFRPDRLLTGVLAPLWDDDATPDE